MVPRTRRQRLPREICLIERRRTEVSAFDPNGQADAIGRQNPEKGKIAGPEWRLGGSWLITPPFQLNPIRQRRLMLETALIASRSAEPA